MKAEMLMARLGRHIFPVFFLGLVASAVLIAAWFAPMNYHVFIGDDLRLLRGDYDVAPAASSFWQHAFAMETNVGKFRPVSNAVILASLQVCHAKFDCYVHVNYAVLALNALLIAVAAFQVSGRWLPTIFFASIAIIVSRFAYYAVLQVMGIMENVSMTLLLVFAISAVGYLKTSRLRWAALAMGAYFLSVCSHERFMVLVVPLITLLILKRRQLGHLGLAASILAVGALTAAYLLLKQVVFHVSVFTGSGASSGASILQTFSLVEFLSFAGQSTLNLIGFNTGPAYLSGANYLDVGLGGILVGVLLSGALAAMLAFWMRQRPWNDGSDQAAPFIFLFVTMGALLVSSSITPRQEYRWFYAPFAALILLVCLILGQISPLRTRAVLLAVVGLAFVSVDAFYKPFNLSNLYFEWSSEMASGVKREIIDNVPASILARKEIYIITHGNQDIQNWVLTDEYFFQVYTDVPTVRVHYVDEMDLLPTNDATPSTTLVFEINNASVRRISNAAVGRFLAGKRARESATTLEYDFVDNFASGALLEEQSSGGPTGQKPFLSQWQDKAGAPYQAITLESPYTLRFPAVTCQPGSSLILSAAVPPTSPESADLNIGFEGAGMSDRPARIRLDRATDDSTVTWSDYNIPVAGCSGAPIDLTLKVTLPYGQVAPASIVVADFRLVSTK